ncbi:MAG: hypothetical protein JSS78_08230 [Bacteroidetes bacterium]|nr:hypothetical protein [Bacteroidota bacterium]
MFGFRGYLLFFSFLLVIFIGRNNYASALGTIHLQHLSEQDGLSDNHITCIIQDQKKFVWVGTSSGLNCIDGSTIHVFKENNKEPNSLPGNIINSMVVDQLGNLWIGTNHGLCVYDYQKHVFFQPFSNLQFPVLSLSVDSRNYLAIGTCNGLFLFQPQKLNFQKISFPGIGKKKIKNNNITQVGFDKQDILWLTNNNGLWRYDVQKKQLRQSIYPNSHARDYFTGFLLGSDNKIWIKNWGQGLILFDIKTNQITKIFKKDSPNIFSVFEITDSGLSKIIINGTSLVINYQTSASIVPTFFSVPTVNFMMMDSQKRLWMGTNEGIFYGKYDLPILNVHYFKEPITFQNVPITEAENKIWVGGSGKNFLRAFNENLEEESRFKIESTNPVLSCLAIQGADKKQLKLGTNNGVVDITIPSMNLSYKTIPTNPNHSPTIDFISWLLPYKSHQWIVFPWRNGIWQWNTTHFTQIANNYSTQEDIAKPLVIINACLDQNGNVWCADLDEGIILYEPEKKQISKPFKKIIGDRVQTPQVLCKDSIGYSFTETILLRWNINNHHLQTIDFSGRINKPITNIALDNEDNLWLATLDGIFAYQFKNNSLVYFTSADGFPSNNMDGTLLKLSSGKILFGCTQYLISFSPKKLLMSVDTLPKIQLTGMTVNGKNYAPQIAEMTFSPDQNSFSFNWCLTDFNNPLDNHYFYKLNGADTTWHNAGKIGMASFASLAPGEYSLFLRGISSNGAASINTLSIKLKILLPIWERWWFSALILSALGGILVLLYSFKMKQQVKLHHLRNQISLDLHDEIGSTLSSISILSNMAHIKNNISEKARESMIHEIEINSIALMEKMDDIVWSVNPRNDHLSDLFIRLQHFATKVFEAKEIAYEIILPANSNEISIHMKHRQHVYLILKEAINNLVKHAQATSAHIEASINSKLILISIVDNGIGFDSINNKTGNGILSMKQRAASIGANLEIHSSPQKGTQILLSAKIS